MLNAQAIREAMTAVLTDVSSKDDAKQHGASPYEGDRGSILLETRMFNETPLNPKGCFDCLTKVINLLSTKGQTLSPQEESDVFFGVTKLFQSSDDRLRRMTYLAIKVLRINESEAFIVTSSLTKDMNSGSDPYRANAIRALSKIVDAGMASQIERYLKTAIVDKSPFVSTAALVCGLALFRTCPELVRRWMNEVAEAVRSRYPMVQFHGLALLYELKRTDRLALHRVVESLTATPLKSPLAECLLIRYIARILRVEEDSTLRKNIGEYLSSRLHHRSEIAVLEAARAICDLAVDGGDVLSACGLDLAPTITALQIMLSSQRSPVRFAAVRTLSKLHKTRPQVVARCNSELEGLLSDSNRSIATLALTTLLKTGHESGVERLTKQISVLMSEIPDGFRVEVVRAVKQLVTAYPSKHKLLVNFLTAQLREEGSFEVKGELVDALSLIIVEIPEAREGGLLHLCEFIEDCEFPTLCIKILSLVGDQVPLTSCPSKFIRFMYNRLILESAAVRAAAVGALTRVGLSCPQLRKDVATLLESCLTDNDDEIRDRSYLYFEALQEAERPETISRASTTDSMTELFAPDLPVALDAAVQYLQNWLNECEKGAETEPLDLSSLPSPAEYQKAQAAVAAAAKAAATAAPAVAPPTVPEPEAQPGAPSTQALLEEVCASVCPNELPIGSLAHSTKGLALTEKEAEYPVVCIKHIFDSNIVILEFQIRNTMTDQTLKDVEVVISTTNSNAWVTLGATKIAVLPTDVGTSSYTVIRRNAPPDGGPTAMFSGTFPAQLKFIVAEEGDALGYDDSYALEPVALGVADYFVPRTLRPGQFKGTWAALDADSEVVTKLSLNYRSLEAAVEGLVETLNLAPCEGSDAVPMSSSSHNLLLAGLSLEGQMVLVRATVVMSPKHGCLVKVICRGKSKELSQSLLSVFD